MRSDDVSPPTEGSAAASNPEEPDVLDDWEVCPVCDGAEGHEEDGEWVNCAHCEGSGGWGK